MKEDVRELRADVKAIRGEMHAGFTAVRAEMQVGLSANRDEMHAGFAAIRGEMHAGFTAIRGEMHSGFAALRESFVGVEKSIAALHATIKTLFWGVGIVGVLATIFFAAGRALHWF